MELTYIDGEIEGLRIDENWWLIFQHDGFPTRRYSNTIFQLFQHDDFPTLYSNTTIFQHDAIQDIQEMRLWMRIWNFDKKLQEEIWQTLTVEEPTKFGRGLWQTGYNFTTFQHSNEHSR